MTCAPSVGLALPLPDRPNRFLLPLPAPSAGHVPVVPSPAAACATRSTRSCSCPISTPSCRPRAMLAPFFWLTSQYMARNQSTKGLRVSWKIVLGRYRGLATTLPTLHQHRPHRPEVIAFATRAAKALRPSQPEQVIPAGLLGCKAGLELCPDSAGIPPPRHTTYWGCLESSKYPPFANVSNGTNQGL